MSKRTLTIIVGLVIFGLGVFAGIGLARQLGALSGPQTKVLLDNARVTVTEVTMAPGVRREPYTRPTDQIIVFIDNASYEATDSDGKKQARRRAAGEIVWHNKGEAAPLLVNTGQKPYRNLVVTFK